MSASVCVSMSIFLPCFDFDHFISLPFSIHPYNCVQPSFPVLVTLSMLAICIKLTSYHRTSTERTERTDRYLSPISLINIYPYIKATHSETLNDADILSLLLNS